MTKVLAALLSWQVLEVRPSIAWDKGKAVEFLLKSLGENLKCYRYILMNTDVTLRFMLMYTKTAFDNVSHHVEVME